MSIAARMESTGKPSQVQCSQQTAELLQDAGKHSWVFPREDIVHAKGKGNVQTYWIRRPVKSSTTNSSSGASDSASNNDLHDNHSHSN